jgi:anti-sigma factor RsiW
VIQFGGACARHRSVLVDFVDHAEIGPATASALAHLDQCSRCTADLEVIVQTITALRRIGDEAGPVEPAVDAWPRLRDRLTRWRPAQWKIMSPVSGMAMSLALVAVLVVPLRFGGASGGAGPSPNLDRVVPSPAERRIEANYISTTHQGVLPAIEAAAKSTGSGPRRYPDDTRPERKEVAPAEPTGRPPEAI